jgi:hypothetical protein
MSISPEFEQEVFEYLDDLRESGATNMFGARSYIMDEFGMSGREEEREAMDLLLKWMKTFGERHPRKETA